MSSFRALMAISATQTKEAQSAVQQALAQRQRNEETRRKQREEQERKDQEIARKLRLKHFEDEKREQERLQRLEQEKLAQAAALQRREEEAKNALRYGPKKAKSLSSTPSAPDGPSPKWPSSSSQSRVRAEVRKRRVPGEDGDDDNNDGPVPEFLTREEKRERKQALEMKKLFQSTKRPGSHSARARKRLPGGAVDVTTSTNTPDLAGASNKSVKERLSAMPNTLTKLNTVKRDTRTIDEILQDRAKAREVKVLDGDEAREFSDWFVSPKKKEITKKLPSPLQQPAIPMAASGANTPASQGSKAGTPTPQSSNPTKKASVPVKSSSSLSKSSSGKTTAASSASSRSATSSRPLPSDKETSMAKSKAPRQSAPYVPMVKKRPRSPSLSDTLPSSKRHAAVANEIWNILGRDRNAYVSRDVFSDDEDMEADASILEREEKLSARIAQQEDSLALEEERRREEEKRRRKKEAMMRERRN